MWSNDVTYQVCQERGSQQEKVDISRIFEFFRINPPSFTRENTIEDRENIIEELKKAFDVIYVVDVETIELFGYQLNNMVKIWFDQWNRGKDKNAPHPSWA